VRANGNEMIPVRDTIPRRQVPMMTWALIAVNAADSAAGRAKAVTCPARIGAGATRPIRASTPTPREESVT